MSCFSGEASQIFWPAVLVRDSCLGMTRKMTFIALYDKKTHKYSLITPHPPKLWESKKKKEKARTVALVKLEFKSWPDLYLFFLV